MSRKGADRASQAEAPIDDSIPQETRQQEVLAVVRDNLSASRPPAFNVRLQTRGELKWFLDYLRQVGDTASSTSSEDTPIQRIDLRGVILRKAIIPDIDLHEANLSNSDLSFSDLTSANLRAANLSGANLLGAILRNTDLSDCEMSATTNLKNVRLDVHTLLGDIKWNDVSITRVDWNLVPRLGDEADIYRKQSRRDYIAACRYAARAYRGLSILMRSQGLLLIASHYRLRQLQVERYAYLAEGKLLSWAGSCVLSAVCGYGERPGRIFVTYAGVILAFAAVYWTVANLVVANESPLLWYEAIVLSLSSFHGRGFFPQMISLGDPLAITASVEAVIGLFIELILIATFSRRFLAN